MELGTATQLAATLVGEDREIVVLGLRLRVMPGVFPPDVFPSTALLAAWACTNVRREARVLDLGCGCGALSVVLATRCGAHGIAADVSKRAVENAKINVERHRLDARIQVVESDVFSGLPADCPPFDFIIWNAPFLLAETKALPREFFDFGYVAVAGFFRGVRRILARGGQAFLGFGSIGDLPLLRRLARAQDYELAQVASFAIDEPGGSFDYFVLELRARDSEA